ncbi:hypothetical protein BGZ83_000244 [Gryganskiella cystojenkinii]|nr:hypothetical protein BGZ83_000244 [Gryganskiella cystojenkinii]
MTQDHLPPKSPGARPEVIIVGAGLGGLALGLLLERAGVPYKILERASVVKPLGSAIAIGAALTPMLRQVGVYQEIAAAGKARHLLRQYNDQGVLLETKDFSHEDGLSILYDAFYKQIPKEKIFHNKRVLTVHNTDQGVRVECKDGSIFEGDLLVGADGAYSTIRQEMFKDLKSQGRLPAEDGKPLPYNCVCLVGQTEALDPEKYPSLKEDDCAFDSMNSIETPYKWVTFTTKSNTICWMVLEFLNETTSKEESQQEKVDNSEWGPQGIQSMCDAIRSFPISIGQGQSGTMGDLIDRTPKDLISKVMLEEKVFETWYSKRTVLLGDACHKLNPAGGAGALSAIQDALCLANWINVLPSTKADDMETIFKEYYSERLPLVTDLFNQSQLAAATGLKTWKGAFVRFFFLHIPNWLWISMLKKKNLDRPQVSFLTAVDDNGTVTPTVQPSLVKTLAILEGLKSAQAQTINPVAA